MGQPADGGVPGHLPLSFPASSPQLWLHSHLSPGLLPTLNSCDISGAPGWADRWKRRCSRPPPPFSQDAPLPSFAGPQAGRRRRQWHPIPVLLPGKSHGWRSLVGCSPWGRKESTRLSDFTFTFHFHALEKEMAAHSSILACRIPGTG